MTGAAGAAAPRVIWSARIGLLVVLTAFVAAGVAAALETVRFADRVSELGTPRCVGVARPDCVARYPASVVAVYAGDDPAVVQLHSSFASSIDSRDECFGRACVNYVRISSSEAGRLHAGDRVMITAGGGRVEAITVGGTTFGTLDTADRRVWATVGGLVTGVWFSVFFACLLAGYLMFAFDMGALWLHPRRWAAAVRSGRVLALAGTAAAVVLFLVGASRVLSGWLLDISVMTALTALVTGHRPTVQDTAAARARFRHRELAGHAFRAAMLVAGVAPLWWASSIGAATVASGAATWTMAVALVVGVGVSAAAVAGIHVGLRREQQRAAAGQPADLLETLPEGGGSVRMRKNATRIGGMITFGVIATTVAWVLATSQVQGGAKSYAIDLAILVVSAGLAARSYWCATVVLDRQQLTAAQLLRTRHWPIEQVRRFDVIRRRNRNGSASYQLVLLRDGARPVRLRGFTWQTSARAAAAAQRLNRALASAGATAPHTGA